mmetsp:Transcript_53576/g.154480  ORF Transcript_53576/g.154480 Transcript_53576/m.154480 type:complete len:203 (-) Transcript_53576:224-832(-)
MGKKSKQPAHEKLTTLLWFATKRSKFARECLSRSFQFVVLGEEQRDRQGVPGRASTGSNLADAPSKTGTSAAKKASARKATLPACTFSESSVVTAVSCGCRAFASATPRRSGPSPPWGWYAPGRFRGERGRMALVAAPPWKSSTSKRKEGGNEMGSMSISKPPEDRAEMSNAASGRWPAPGSLQRRLCARAAWMAPASPALQ